MPSYRSEINRTLKQLMTEDESILLLGQSIRDPYGGACKVTRGLTKHFPDRIIDLPICEAASMGLCTGLAMQGYKPILEIMFSDFITLCADQIYNIANKIHEHHQPIKIIIRTMDGAHPHYGWTHSQDMSDFMVGLDVNFLRMDNNVICRTVYETYRWALAHDYGVTVLLEDKSLYSKQAPC